ncbi:MAG: UvrD-helicase domain-containing protein [Clostridia bacterium]|nr:UvrD-helicase domain-containing protein [Clostridia bacterium]
MILSGLNHAQREAVTATEGYIRVIAGAGSGKTRALAHRYAYLVNEMGILPENILCVTFTNKSANEMRKRIRRLSADSDTAYISTFHSFCDTVLHEDINIVHYPKNFVVLDNMDIDAMLSVVYEERGLTMRHRTFSQARDMIEMKKCLTEPEYYEPMLSLSIDELHDKYMQATNPDDIIFWGYVYQEKKCFALDYNDLINFVLYIFRISEETKLKWQERLEYIMVDEYQDIDGLQYRLMKELCPMHGNLFVVGDPDQTIYTWRGANVKYIMEFDKEFPNVRTIMMNQNYRSTPQILAAANSLISKNINRVPKDLISMKDESIVPVYFHADTGEQEAQFIAHEIKELQDKGVALHDIAILYRAHYLSRQLEDVFLKNEINYTIYSGVQFFERMEIKDALSYLRMIIYKDDLSFTRIVNTPKRNIGEKRMAFLRDYALENNCTLYTALQRTIDDDIFHGTKARNFIQMIEDFASCYTRMTLSDMLTFVMDRSGYEEMLRLEGGQNRLDNLAELKQAIMDYEDSCGEECRPEDYLDRVALMTNTDVPDSDGCVKMMTVHTAKGLEFPYVFMVDMNEGIFPSRKTSSKEAMEEERRLAFVAATRAMDGLYITDSEGKNLDGSFRYPSRFIFNIDKELLDYKVELDPLMVGEAQQYINASDLTLSSSAANLDIETGDRVRHNIMGDGTVIEVDRNKNCYIIKFDDLSTNRKISFKAKLEKIIDLV